jgi:hypothetical protein
VLSCSCSHYSSARCASPASEVCKSSDILHIIKKSTSISVTGRRGSNIF